MEDFVLLRSTYADEAAARQAARALIDARLAACAHVQRLAASVYRWDGDVVDEPEWLLEARVPARLRKTAGQAIEDAHPYDVPLVEAIEVAWIAASYGAWASSVAQ